MDAILLLLIIALIVVIVLFVVTLRAGAATTRRAAVANSGRQAADRPAIAAPQQQAQEPRASATSDASSLEQSRAGGSQETRRLLADTSEGGAAQAPVQTFAPPQAGDVATVVGQQSSASAPSQVEGPTMATATATLTEAPREPGPDAAPVNYRAGNPGSAGETPALPDNADGARVDGDNVRYTADIPPTTAVTPGAPSREATEPATVGMENAAPVAAAPLSANGAPADDGSVDTETALELAGPPATRTGAVMLSVTPQRLPYRLAELLGEQRGLEEAITIAHRRIDDIELGPDPGGSENRVRLAVLRQDLSQKQERLREILFLQDGYRWLQQHMAPERTPSES